MSKLEGLRHVQEPKGLLRKPPAPGSPAKFPAEPTFSASPNFSQQQLEEAGSLIQASQLMELIGAFQNASLTPGFLKLGHSHTAPGLGSPGTTCGDVVRKGLWVVLLLLSPCSPTRLSRLGGLLCCPLNHHLGKAWELRASPPIMFAYSSIRCRGGAREMFVE